MEHRPFGAADLDRLRLDTLAVLPWRESNKKDEGYPSARTSDVGRLERRAGYAWGASGRCDRARARIDSGRGGWRVDALGPLTIVVAPDRGV
ncbi:MAG: hypothetical protein U5K74_01495 [Gemmatimonadaceae bacterium]|nr:hypothetical protein [Gemmatimonadaceae bacterium]